jgi:hypothetical protein
VSWFAEDGETYYIFVHAGYSVTGEFGLSVTSFTTVENDSCDGASGIAVGSLTSGSTVSSTADDMIPDECFIYFDRQSTGGGVWYTVIGTGSTLLASACSRTYGFEPALNVFSGPCSNLTCSIEISTFQYNSGCNEYYGGYSISWASEADVEYHILVFSAYSSMQLDFDLTLTSTEPVENDSCINAISLSSTSAAAATSVEGSTLAATRSDFDACGLSNGSADVWYTIEGSGMMLTVSTCGQKTTFDTQISIYSGSCTDLTCIVTNDDFCEVQSSVTWVTEVGELYFVRVHGYGYSAGHFELTTSQQTNDALANDRCIDALEITPTSEGSFVSGSTFFATEDIFDIVHCGTFIVAPGVWYRLDGTGGALEASTCSDLTNFYTSISVFSGDCGTLTCLVGASDDPACAASMMASSVRWLSTLGTTYFILVHGHDEPSRGVFGLTVREIATTRNHVCEEAESISTDGAPISGETVPAPFDNFYFRDCGFYIDSPSAWYTFQGTGSGLEASTCSNVTDLGASVGVFTGDCGNLECVQVFESQTCGSTSAVQFMSNLSEKYYIAVFGTVSDDTGGFSLSVSEFSVVENDACRTAIEIGFGSEVNGSTTMATVDSTIARCDDATAATSKGVWYFTTGNGSRYLASTCNGTNFDTQISVFSGGCDGGLECVAGNDQSCGDQSEVEWDTTAGTVYYILVHGWSSFYGDFTLKLDIADLPTR